jgi:ATP-dependent RNA helicase RhlE
MTFSNLGLSKEALHDVERAGFVEPTPVQRAAIPVALSGRDVIGCAQTGTGKTAAFVLPILDRIRAKAASRALILAPTRELAIQIRDTILLLSSRAPVETALVLGGLGMEPQVAALARRPPIIVATPGRLIDHLDRRTARLDGVSVLVLDEADRMLDMGFMPQIERILARVPRQRQTLLFSATMPDPKDAMWGRLLSLGLSSPVRVQVEPPRVAKAAEQALLEVDRASKTTALLELLRAERGSVLVFTRTKHRADRVAKQLATAGHRADRIHGNRSQAQRRQALEGFKSGRVRVLVATDIAARGIDVEGIAHVVNYDLPTTPEDYVHRVGRTARAQRTGRATSFVLKEERPTLRAIEQWIGARLEPRGGSA